MLSTLIKTRFRGLTLVLSLLLLISGVLICARWESSASPPVQSTQPQNQGSDAQVEAELVTATPTGFEPGEITRPQGRFLLAIDNQSGLDQLDLYLERDTGARLNMAIGRRGKLKWREILDLPPGRYILRAAHDQSWRCVVNLTPR
jgi:hypothetical protein